jgi:hypothetical protein
MHSSHVFLLACIVSYIAAQRSYTIDFITSNVSISGCTATVDEVFELNFNGVYSYFYRTILDSTLNGGQQAVITDFNVNASTSNIKITSYSVSRHNKVATRLSTEFSTSLTSIGVARFHFKYNIQNLVSNTENNSSRVPI